MNKKVYFAAFLLIVITAALITSRIFYGGQTIRPEFKRSLWRVNIIMDLMGTGSRAKVRFTLPKETERQTIYNEHFNNEGMVFYIRDRENTKNRIGFWRSELLNGSKTIKYTFSVLAKSADYQIPAGLVRPKKPLEFYPAEFQPWLLPSIEIQSQDPRINQYLSKTISKNDAVGIAVQKIFTFVTTKVKYQSEKGSKDATSTLDQLVADCGGQARLFVALSRAAGIPSRIVGGVILENGVKKITHVWAENYIGNQWIPFDVVNRHYAYMPANYLELYRGDYILIKHVGLSSFNYFFSMGRETIPPVDQPWSLYSLPLHFQNTIYALLLLPIGTLVVGFARVIIGIPTFGTFAPILLALAFREISVFVGVSCVTGVVFLGWLMRTLLDYFKILIIPRLSIVITTVVIVVIAIMMTGFHSGKREMLYVSLFPIVIITWIIERFAVIQVEDGTKAAFQGALGTTVVAIGAYYLMEFDFVKKYLFAFPEILLTIIAIQLLLGRYTGIRLTELFRFNELKKVYGKKQS
ncbi:MAG: hypothetical protein A3G33_10395 [Omnitrophica bacterium RIFCSPLOWO2_12_FULL_44_17]|uniref:Transglutaminase-like domain-containing protein n=1 Tax=Candidatus Danuiimicrobium aquiferis TaxID=1801832 RepID=A0A1G1L135_9BACT|nr:MAG: hypothetical protein A3B72_01670 [Omnitrophica bacterium RIFCSPHIGHO2_02_FULL_45_28]OGW90463.1 MAG: hypothetical protein A3E74_03605 [Omnitrophica bacterium RIFCSPHIGHO2_12_FULL_44_12]OGW98848.1 MAG: hypothetical protein A3G33_10395 [Omnitrophica bacterium RIFCSPLOWO2_12_FULL_44_17]OGX02809.1 MAG: hypothetical protein A3J12_02515 [Omnitrophica bacterium RIFCSPLOWO2_02_FULL_44_11]